MLTAQFDSSYDTQAFQNCSQWRSGMSICCHIPGRSLVQILKPSDGPLRESSGQPLQSGLLELGPAVPSIESCWLLGIQELCPLLLSVKAGFIQAVGMSKDWHSTMRDPSGPMTWARIIIGAASKHIA